MRWSVVGGSWKWNQVSPQTKRCAAVRSDLPFHNVCCSEARNRKVLARLFVLRVWEKKWRETCWIRVRSQWGAVSLTTGLCSASTSSFYLQRKVCFRIRFPLWYLGDFDASHFQLHQHSSPATSCNHLLSTQMANHPITWQHVNAFWCLDIMKTVCWSSSQASGPGVPESCHEVWTKIRRSVGVFFTRQTISWEQVSLSDSRGPAVSF